MTAPGIPMKGIKDDKEFRFTLYDLGLLPRKDADGNPVEYLVTEYRDLDGNVIGQCEYQPELLAVIEMGREMEDLAVLESLGITQVQDLL